jgi:putative flavoprotein involved in K+ transport
LEHAHSPDREVAAWLSRFGQLLANGDIEAAAELFLPDSFWRDIVAFTWNIHTAEGQDAIRDMLQTCLGSAKPTAWQANGPARAVEGIVQGTFTFETEVGRGIGVLRLKDGRCWTILTTLAELKGHEETVRHRRPVGLAVNEYHPGRESWRERRERDAAEIGVTRQPYCLVVGAGLSGLALGARLKQLNVPTLLIDRLERPSDVWRNRYDTLVTNSPSAADHLPYMPFPDNWPAFPSKDQIANWLDAYASIMELDIWCRTECRRAIFDEARDEWIVDVVRDGRAMTLRPRQLVFATGFFGPPHVPDFPGAADFAGEQIHSASFRTVRPYRGRRCVVIGADVSGHDIAAALWEAGADVTMVQRSPVIIVARDALIGLFQELFSDTAVDRGVTPEQADLLMASLPLRLMEQQHAKIFAEIRQRDAELYRRLEEAGFQLTDGEDHTGFLPQLNRRGAGYYIDVGASRLIIDGSIKLRSRVKLDAITKHGVLLSDGTELPADVIIYATGYDRAKIPAWQILPDEVRNAVGKLWGYGSGFRGDPGPWDGELRNVWKPTQQRGLWFDSGGFLHARFYSKALALQIKAREAGIPTSVYKIPETHCID